MLLMLVLLVLVLLMLVLLMLVFLVLVAVFMPSVALPFWHHFFRLWLFQQIVFATILPEECSGKLSHQILPEVQMFRFIGVVVNCSAFSLIHHSFFAADIQVFSSVLIHIFH